MSRKEVSRAGLVQAALAGKITNVEGARALRLSVRQVKRLKARRRASGVRGLLHRSRGQPSPRRLAAELRTQVVTLMTTIYEGFNDVHLTEKLQEQHALPISRATVRRPRAARPARRQPLRLAGRSRAGRHAAWPHRRCHVHPLALWFRPTEDLHGYLTVLGQTCRRYGVPVTLYGDRLHIFRRNDRHWTLEEQLRGQQDPTHFGRVLAELGIGFIAAQSPQAKGASSGSGKHCKIAWSVNCVSTASARSRRPTPFSPRSSLTSDRGLRGPRPASRRRGGRRRAISIACSAVAIRAASPATTLCA